MSANKELQQGYSDYSAASDQAALLNRLITAMQKGELTDELLEHIPELGDAKKLNDKLKYRKSILEKSIAEQAAKNKKNGVKATSTSSPSSSTSAPAEKKAKKDGKTGGAPPKQAKKVDYVTVEDYGSSIFGRLQSLFKKAIEDAFPGLDVPLLLAETPNPQFGDYQCNSAMPIAAKLKANKINKRPGDVAKEIQAKLPTKIDFVEKIDVMPAGFINIFLNTDYLRRQISLLASEGVKLPKLTRKRVLVDFSSPNIAKEMHVGHLRSTIIGDSICRLFEAVGFDVLRVNHIGDWGTQFGMLIAHLYDRFPDFLKKLPDISDLQAFYKESKKRFDEDEQFKKRAYEYVVKLQSHDGDIVKAWNTICDVSKKYNQIVYNYLDIKIKDVGESFYQDKMIELVKWVKTNKPDMLREEDGRQIMFPTGCDIPLTVVKSDGGFTYDTSDLAALKYRMLEEKCDWNIYVVDSGQSLHLETVYAAGRDFGWYDESIQRVEHVAFGLVLGDDKKKFKTRSGETVRLLDLLSEGVKRATEKLIEKGRETAMSEEQLVAARDAVAFGCVKYADLSHTRTQDYVFSFDRMLEDRGNTAVYLLYAYTRIQSIFEKDEVKNVDLVKYIASTPTLPLDHPGEFKLAKQLLKLSDCVLLVLDSLMLHQMCDYVYQLATLFHDFYNECYVIENKEGGIKTICPYASSRFV
ncbi:putative arginine--tRNA ligase, cytoplasmic [Caenorhabditis elegans]|uniref:Probable arginine--tRNA ligase, cytoplasmic n=1 Tax=Caenorhabditis elegans TaxID=6239 RepID=Q65ZK0_CAEEL|nr:arginine--tRNA ligase [Caenorhabditis elegans]CCD65758.1 arginine--tRNA ligase [Caenorhabditis elegans]|eukprot:NP_001022552.1 Probable arginine--tRNA ligase, cytoplasmic [Caenorhabditis elegans]